MAMPMSIHLHIVQSCFQLSRVNLMETLWPPSLKHLPPGPLQEKLVQPCPRKNKALKTQGPPIEVVLGCWRVTAWFWLRIVIAILRGFFHWSEWIS